MKSWSKIKPKVNLIIDAIMFVDLAAVAGLGFLMKYVLLPGYKINELYGAGTELYFLGLDRHQWGSIHLYLALFMIFLLVLHIIFHWDMIICIFKLLIASRKLRVGITVLLVITGLLLFAVPLFVKPEVAQLERKHNRNRTPGFDAVINYQAVPDTQQSSHHNQVDIDGTMTLSEISGRFNISIEELAKVIDIPVEYANERLGRLRKRFGFEIDDLRTFVLSNSEEGEN